MEDIFNPMIIVDDVLVFHYDYSLQIVFSILNVYHVVICVEKKSFAVISIIDASKEPLIFQYSIYSKI